MEKKLKFYKNYGKNSKNIRKIRHSEEYMCLNN